MRVAAADDICERSQLAPDQRERLGCVGVVTDAKPDAVAFYERYGFVPLEGVRALHQPSPR